MDDPNSVARPAIPGTDQYGRVTNPLDAQTQSALTQYQTILQKPRLPYENLVTPRSTVAPGAITPTKTVAYTDQYGRQAVGMANDQNDVVRGPTVTAGKPKAPPVAPKPPVDPVQTVNSAPAPPSPPPNVNSVPIDSVPGLLSLAQVGSSIYDIATLSWNAAANTGWTAFAMNGIDSLGASTGGFSYGGTDYTVSTGPGQTTLSNALGYGLAGGTLSQLLGLGYDSGGSFGNFAVNIGSSVAGGVAGGAAGAAALGSSFGAIAGPLGALIGGFLFNSIAGLFGPGPPNGYSTGVWNTSDGSIIKVGGAQDKKFNPANLNYRVALHDGATAIANSIASQLGGTNTSQYRIAIGQRTGLEVYAGNNLGWGDTWTENGAPVKSTTVKDGKEALGYLTKNMLRTQQGLDADTTAVQQGIDWNNTTFDQAWYDMKFAKDYQSTALSFFNGNFNVDQDRDAAIATVNAWETKAKSLFKDDDHKDYASRAAIAARATINQKFNKP